MNKKGQGAIEYLLLIAAAIIIVAIVIVAMVGGMGQGQEQGKQGQQDNNKQIQQLNCLKDCNYYGACTTTTACGQFRDICVPDTTTTTCAKR